MRRLLFWLARRAWIEVRAAAINFGYWLRPYDVKRDARCLRWRRLPCFAYVLDDDGILYRYRRTR